MSRRIVILGSLILGMVLLLVILGKLGTSGNGTGAGSKLSEPVSDHDRIKGSANAVVTLVEYSDFQCPACGAVYPIIKRLTEEFPDKLRVVYRYFPLSQIHPNAEAAAHAAEAAHLQGKFWEMHDMLFNTQNNWSKESDPKEFFVGLAGSLNLNIDQFKTEMESNAVKDVVKNSYESGVASQVGGTPTFFLNNEKIDPPSSYDEFRQLVESKTNP